uniref:CLOCK interacting protein, circadian n=2 Tax=Mus musculus TaxID=10090 RepID=A0A087WPE5_MOUSE
MRLLTRRAGHGAATLALRVIHMQRVPVLRLPAILDMERKIPSRESPRRLSAKPGRGTEMKKLARPLGVVAADSDKDSGFSG